MNLFFIIMIIVWICYAIYDLIVGNYDNLKIDSLVIFFLSIFLLIKNIRSKSREDKIMESCGNVCYCPNCQEPLNDNSECEKVDESGIYRYTCVKCSTKSVFHFGIAPCPIYLDDYDKEMK